MKRVHVLGAAGYAAGELMRIVGRHPYLELGVLESASSAGQPVAALHPYLRANARTFDPPGTIEAELAPDDVVVLAGGAEQARAVAHGFLAHGASVLDLSDAFRLEARAGEAIYGLTERYREALRGARFVANPGCYPTATLLALLPLASFAGEIEQLIVDAKSGITGSGRKAVESSLFAEVDGDVRAYGLDGHRHEPEIAQELAAVRIAAPLVFTPHVVPLRRGLLADCYAVFRHEPGDDALRAAFARAYESSPFIRVLPAGRAPSLVAVAGTNDAELHLSRQGRVVRVIAAIDNLGKGAAGQAVQNINLMLGFPEECALDDRSVVV